VLVEQQVDADDGEQQGQDRGHHGQDRVARGVDGPREQVRDRLQRHRDGESAEQRRREGHVIRVEGLTVDLSQLHNKLAAIARQFKNQPVRIRGDGKVAYQRIVEVIDTCQKAGIWNISFATQRPVPAE